MRSHPAACAPCAGLWDLELDIDYLTAVKDEQELRLEKGSESLRTIKGQNEQVPVGALYWWADA